MAAFQSASDMLRVVYLINFFFSLVNTGRPVVLILVIMLSGLYDASCLVFDDAE